MRKTTNELHSPGPHGNEDKESVRGNVRRDDTTGATGNAHLPQRRRRVRICTTAIEQGIHGDFVAPKHACVHRCYAKLSDGDGVQNQIRIGAWRTMNRRALGTHTMGDIYRQRCAIKYEPYVSARLADSTAPKSLQTHYAFVQPSNLRSRGHSQVSSARLNDLNFPLDRERRRSPSLA